MSVIIKLFKTIWEGLVSTIQWVVGVPGLIISSIVGLTSSISELLESFNGGDNISSAVTQQFSDSVNTFVTYVDSLPDVIHVAMYTLSLDVLFDVLLTIWGLFLTLSCSFIVFFAVTIPVWVGSMYLIKFTAFTLTILLPNQWVISGLSSLANMRISDTFSKPLKDGKYDFRLGG